LPFSGGERRNVSFPSPSRLFEIPNAAIRFESADYERQLTHDMN